MSEGLGDRHPGEVIVADGAKTKGQRSRTRERFENNDDA